MLQLQLCLSGDFLIREGDLGHEMYFVRIGSLEVVKKGVDHRLALLGCVVCLLRLHACMHAAVPWRGVAWRVAIAVALDSKNTAGDPIVLNLLHGSPGSVIGEIAVLHEQARTASVRALTLSHLFMLTKENFDKVRVACKVAAEGWVVWWSWWVAD